MSTSPSRSDVSPLTDWLETLGPSRALLIEDGSAGGISPLARWLEGIAAVGSQEVISVSMGTETALFMERDILVRLYVELHPDAPEVPDTFSLAQLRDHVRADLRADESDGARLVALDRASWAERSFRENLGGLLTDLRPEQKVVVSLRVDDQRELDLAAWYERLGWRTSEALCVRLPAQLDGERPPVEQARDWIDACIAAERSNGGRTTDVLDVLASALRPMRLEEVASILDLKPDIVEGSLRFAPAGAVAIDPGERYHLRDLTVARAWAELRRGASDRVRDRTLALGEAVLRGEARRCSPYVIEHYGSLLFDRGGLEDQVSVVSEAWANAWSSLGNLLGFEADVERVWSLARRELLDNALAPAPSRSAPLVTIFRCAQVSNSIMYRVREAGSTAKLRARALAALAEELTEPQRTRVRECAIDTLLAVDLADLRVSQTDLLMRFAKWFKGERRDVIVEKILELSRADIAEGGNSVRLLRVALLLSPGERRALYDEVTGQLHKLSDEDAWALRDALRVMPPEEAPLLVRARLILPPPDRFRFDCALAPYLEGNARQRFVDAILDTAKKRPFRLGSEDLRSAARALDAAQLSHLFMVLQGEPNINQSLGICIRALCAMGHANRAAELAGPDLGGMPFDWLLALAVSLRDQRPELREELEKRLAAMDEVRLGWTIDRDTAELVSVLGVDLLLRLARSISADEECIVARLALVPFAAEAEKRALVTEAVETFRASPAGDLHWYELLSCCEWMSVPDACYLLTHGSDIDRPLSAFEALAPQLNRLGGPDLPLQIAEQLIEVGRWAP